MPNNSLLQVPQTPNQQLNTGFKTAVKEIGAGIQANTQEKPLGLGNFGQVGAQNNPFMGSIMPIQPLNFGSYQPVQGIRFANKPVEQKPVAYGVPPMTGQTITPAVTGNYQPQTPSVSPLAPSVQKTYTTPSGVQVTTNADGSQVSVNPQKDFSVGSAAGVGTDVLNQNKTVGDIMQKRSAYEQAVQQLQQANQLSPEYIKAYENLNNSKLQEQQLNVNLLNGNVVGDTLDSATGRTNREKSYNALDQMAATNKLQLLQAIREGNIGAAKALVEASAPKSVSVGTSLVNPITGQATYQSDYLYKPSAQQISTIATSLLASGQAQDYATAYNMAQEISLNSAQGQAGFTNGGAEAAQSPVYQNVIAQLQQGVPIDKVYYSKSNSVGAAYAQQAINDFLSGNPQYNTVTAGAQVKANAASYAEQQKYYDTVSRAYTTAIQNAQVLKTFMEQNGINQSNVPISNQLQNKVKAGLTDAGTIAAFQSSLIGLRQEYAQVLARGGQVTDKARGEADNSIPDTLSPAQLDQVFTQLNKEGANALRESQGKITEITKRMEMGSGVQQSATQGGHIDVSQASW